MWNPPLTSAAFDSTQQVLPSFKRHIFFPFFLTSAQLSGDKKLGPTDVVDTCWLDNGRKAPQNHHRFTLRQTASTTLALLDGWMDGDGDMATPKCVCERVFTPGANVPEGFNQLSIARWTKQKSLCAAAPRISTSGLYDTSQPFTHRFAQFVRRFETVEKLRHGSCLGTLPEPIAQPRVPDICLSDNGNGALGALDTSSNSISGTWPRLPLAGPISTPLLALSELAVAIAVLRSVSALRSRYVGRYAMATREITKRSMLGKARKHNRL
ncbi:hypothetical protein CMEL01_16125 [Colletotrichum melonis]|uniref:Uncharacterized protein n=1 Tax=Colletotrichum melonis TaxID=1209925 RepID=A0AAI9XNF6_9PEZI|nr:hypothetical protein CMEL01_16125 [Colletotrichum melonis]